MGSPLNAVYIEQVMSAYTHYLHICQNGIYFYNGERKNSEFLNLRINWFIIKFSNIFEVHVGTCEVVLTNHLNISYIFNRVVRLNNTMQSSLKLADDE